jgi:CRP-like cAMP-binding protein
MIPVETLRRYPYFAGASKDTLRSIAEATEERSFESGDTLFLEGDTADALVVVEEGEVEIEFEFREAGRMQAVDTVTAGEMMAWSAMLAPYQMRATAVARRKGRLLAINAVRLRDFCDRDPRFGYHLMQLVASAVASRLDGARVQLASADWTTPA